MPAEHDAALEQRFLALVSSHDDSDWFDVRLRARETAARHSRRRLGIALVGVTILVAALLATPALGLGDRLVRLFEDEEPAPPHVEKDFATFDVGAPPGMAPGVKAAEARHVETFTLGDGRRIALWVAPREEGGFCLLFEESTGGCTPKTPSELSVTVQTGDQHMFGYLPKQVGASLWIVLKNSDEIQIPLAWVGQPIDAGFFAYRVPDELRDPSRTPSALVVRDSGGNSVSRTSWASLFNVPAPPSLD
jgi:hypothetical protein